MEFAVYDLNKDTLEISVFDKDLFSPNGKTASFQFGSYITRLVPRFIRKIQFFQMGLGTRVVPPPFPFSRKCNVSTIVL